MSYTVLEGYNLGTLIKRVQDFVLEGWRPVGGVACANGLFYQALTRG